jgi:hypothetical protein
VGGGDVTPEMCDYIRRGADVRRVLVKGCGSDVDHSRLGDTAVHFKAKLERARFLLKRHVHHAAGNRLRVCARQNFCLLRSKGAICDAVAVHSPQGPALQVLVSHTLHEAAFCLLFFAAPAIIAAPLGHHGRAAKFFDL